MGSAKKKRCSASNMDASHTKATPAICIAEIEWPAIADRQSHGGLCSEQKKATVDCETLFNCNLQSQLQLRFELINYTYSISHLPVSRKSFFYLCYVDRTPGTRCLFMQ